MQQGRIGLFGPPSKARIYPVKGLEIRAFSSRVEGRYALVARNRRVVAVRGAGRRYGRLHREPRLGPEDLIIQGVKTACSVGRPAWPRRGRTHGPYPCPALPCHGLLAPARPYGAFLWHYVRSRPRRRTAPRQPRRSQARVRVAHGVCQGTVASSYVVSFAGRTVSRPRVSPRALWCGLSRCVIASHTCKRAPDGACVAVRRRPRRLLSAKSVSRIRRLADVSVQHGRNARA